MIIFIVCTSFASAQKKGIGFEKPNWKQVLLTAQKEKKIIFLDCYTSWCGPCHWMEENVYTNDTVANFYNSNFICVKINMEKEDGFELAKKFKINSYPTFLYLTDKEEVLYRTCGSSIPKVFVEIGKDALNPETQLTTIENQFKKDISNSIIAYRYFELLEKADLLERSVIEKYLSAQKDSNLTSPLNWKIIYKYADFKSKAYQYFEKNRFLFYELYNIDSIENKINLIYIKELKLANDSKNKKKFEELKTRLRKLKIKKTENIIDHADAKLARQRNTDIINAMEITDSIVGPTNVSLGHGNVMEFQYQDPGDIYHHITSEENSAWFKLNIEYDTLLSFDIVPEDSLDDYDFALFKYNEDDFKKDLKSNNLKLKPERLCYSYCTSKSGNTGLSKYTTKMSVGLGKGPAYVSAIPVKKGETYYLYVDCFNSSIAYNNNQMPLGFTIYFYNYWPKRKPIVLNTVLFENNKAVLPPECFPELNKLVLRLRKGQIKIEILGHADGKGNEQENQVLSEERAKAVKDYLVSKNIKPDQIYYKGLGSTKPIASNKTEEGRKLNRRVEFVIVLN